MGRPLTDIIAAGLEPDWDHRLERSLFGSDDPSVIATAVERVVDASLGAAVASGVAYRSSVNVVVGVELGSGESLAVKFVRPDRAAVLDGALAVQHAARRAGLPAPEPLVGPLSGKRAVVLIDRWLDPGPPDDPASRSTRRALAVGLTSRCEHSDRELGVIPGADRPFADQLRALATR